MALPSLAARRLAEHGVKAASPQELAAQCQVILFSLPDGKAMQAVVAELEPHLKPGQCIVDTSTSSVAATREIGARLEAKGILFADAPVARTREAAAKGELSIMVGASDSTYEHVRAILETMGSDVSHCGPIGCGQVVKILNNMLVFQHTAALAEATARIELIAAIKPLLYHPVVLAKMAMGIEQISQGRFAINLVNAWNGAELENAGLPFPAHDARYDYGAEWLAVVERLFTGETLTHHGRHFQVTDYRLRPPSAWRARPRIYLGGESEPARALAARSADTWFMNAQPLAQVAALIADLRPRPRGTLAPLDFGLSAFVVARPSEAEAIAAHDRLLALAAQDRAMRAGPAGRVDPAVVMRRSLPDSVGTNGGSAAGLVGSYAQVAERIRRFHAAGVGTFLLQFQPFEAEMRRFAAEVMPRVSA
jgi:alkanesulfonate monooxygenase